MSLHILLVEDDAGLSLTISDLLKNENYQVTIAVDGREGMAKASTGAYDLILLDVMLPGKNGFEVCRDLRAKGCDTAILMLTARSQLPDRVVGLRLGADDYLAKPFDPAELLARIEAILRRASGKKRIPLTKFDFGAVSVDFGSGQVTRDKELLAFTAKEFHLLRYLVDRRGSVISRDELMKDVWHYQADVSSRTIDVHVAALRQKLEENPQVPKHIHTVRGVGYRFTP